MAASIHQSLRNGASVLFEIASTTRHKAYERGWLTTTRISRAAVVCVGGLRTGGSGKTPLAMHIASVYRDWGFETALLLRGYRGFMERAGGLVSEGSGPIVHFRDAGDEAYLAAKRLQGVQVRVGADRVRQAQLAADSGARAIVLDDGFQHYGIHRDLNILLLCPEDLNPQTRLLPAGPLRERAIARKRAHLTAGLFVDWKDNAGFPEVVAEFEPRCLVDREFRVIPLNRFEMRAAHLLCGIARPERFQKIALAAGLEIAGRSFFPDHHRFSSREVQGVEKSARAAGADLILTTEKDLARLPDCETTLPIRGLRIEVHIVRGASALQGMLRRAVEKVEE